MSNPETLRHFTLEQANAVVQAIRPLVAEVLEIRRAVVDRQPEVWPVLAKAAGNGGSQAASQIAWEFQRMDALVREILATGAILKDVNTGLVDFLSIKEGRPVYLCWKYGEDHISYWHELEAGLAGRQPLE
jgi:hypothetical protein